MKYIIEHGSREAAFEPRSWVYDSATNPAWNYSSVFHAAEKFAIHLAKGDALEYKAYPAWDEWFLPEDGEYVTLRTFGE
jgi:hypothetical protein